jgi:hypothetical protein
MPKPVRHTTGDVTDAPCQMTMISCESRCRRLELREEFRPTGYPTPTPRNPPVGAPEVSLSLRGESGGDGLPPVISGERPLRFAPPRARAGVVSPLGLAAT